MTANRRHIGRRDKKDRAGNVTGTVWRARYVDDQGREHTRHFPTKKAGNEWLDEATAALVTGTHVAPRDGALALAAYYRGHAALQVWEPTTRRAMDLAVAGATFADTPLRDITPSMVQGWIKHMQADGLAATTIRTRHNNVRSVLRAALNDRKIPRDPTTGVQLPAPRKREAAMSIPTTAEIKALLGRDHYWTPAWALAAFAGLRLGELLAIKPDDIDFLARQIHVRRQVQRLDGPGVEVRLPKYKSERTVNVPDGLLLLLAQHIETQPHREWLFSIDTAPHPNTAEHQWRRAKEAAGITRTLRLHDLRHFYASGLIAAGCDVVTVQRALGHARASVTLDTYSHLWPGADDRIRDASGAMWKQIRDYAGTTDPETGAAEHENGAG